MEKWMLAFLSLITINFVPVNCDHKNEMVNKIPEEPYDGPYVQYKGKHLSVNYIIEINGAKILRTQKIALDKKDDVSLNVPTDIPGKSFHVGLKKELNNEKSEYPQVTNMVVISDIEGNFGALRKLLQATKVVDADLNWKFGDGNLILVGDFFDRGQQVTEILWLIYYLEEKAKAAGGYVHFILGNHEIMNLNGDLRYVTQKYLDNAILLKEDYVTLYNENSELGRWLRTKNVVEKIGDLLFTHGGISGNINRMNIPLAEINNLARPYYADSTYNFKDPRTDTIFSDLGPFWYRGYYEKGNPGIALQVDSTLYQFSTKHIITGHSIVADTISVWYNGKLLNTDVHHAGGKSEALVIEGNRYHRVNQAGNKVLLMDEKLP